MKQTKCKGCGAPISFIKTAKGKWAPVNPRPIYFEPDPHGDIFLLNSRGEYVRGYGVPPHGVYDPHRVGYLPHWKSCPAASSFKDKQQEKTAKAVEAAREAETQRAAKEAAKRELLEAQKKQLSFY
ncbi:MAG: hypothetical protein ACK5L3_13700 [Oscillospiraceae bacterium]